MGYITTLATLCMIQLILAQSLNLCFGLGGMLNLALLSSYAIGAYTVALLSTEHQIQWVPCILLSLITSGIVALLVGGIAARLRRDSFLIGTLAASSLVTALLINWKSLTRGVLGVPGIPRPTIFGRDLATDDLGFTLFCAFWTIIALAILLIVFRSSFGRQIRALAENPQLTESIGVNCSQARFLALFISSSMAGLAGALFAYFMRYIDPSSFGLNEIVTVLAGVILGRPGSYFGVIAATTFLVLLPEPLRFLDIPSSVLGPIRQLLYALIIYLVLLWKRERLFPIERQV